MNNAIAETILKQLGGNRFLAMTGAKQLMSDEKERSLTFKLPRGFASTGVVCMVIKLDDGDTYTVKAYDSKGLKSCIATRVVTGIYADSLRNLFTQMTGLDTHL